MTWAWQNLTALLIVAGAFAYIVRHSFHWLRRRKSSACGGGCFGCHQAEAVPSEIVQIGISKDPPTASPERRRSTSPGR